MPSLIVNTQRPRMEKMNFFPFLETPHRHRNSNKEAQLISCEEVKLCMEVIKYMMSFGQG